MSIYSDKTYRKRAAAQKFRDRKNGTPCWICGEAFDYDLPTEHRMAWTADHLVPIANGGKLLGELRGAHRSCNSKRGKGNPIKKIPGHKKTRNWYS